MGNADCSCIRESKNEQHLLIEPEKQTEKQEQGMEEEVYNIELANTVTQSVSTLAKPASIQLIPRLTLQSLGRGFLIRLAYSSQVQEAKRRKMDQQALLESRKPENRYKAITSNLDQLFKGPTVQKMNSLYGKFDISQPLADDIPVEGKPTFLIEDGLLYKGEWDQNGCKHGRGREVHPDGSQYVGYFRNGRMDGQGRLIHPNGDMYEGEFQRGRVHGQGLLRYENGDAYEGEFKFNLKRGSGEERLANGCVYRGEFMEGKRHGSGTLVKPNKDIYEGEFKNGLIHGSGTYKRGNDFTYTGEWRDGKMHGQGRLATKQGVYEGGFENDVKQGFGRFVYSDERVYEGHWKDGQHHGEGWFGNSKSGRRGIWKNGKRFKWLD